jgi:hypothetical protein
MNRYRQTGRTHRIDLNTEPQVRVTLSDDLLKHLRKTAQQTHVPLRWLVAGLVYDTMEARVSIDCLKIAGRSRLL